MGTLTVLALISLLCGAVLGGTVVFVFGLPWILGLFIGVVTVAGLFLIGLVLSTMT